MSSNSARVTVGRPDPGVLSRRGADGSREGGSTSCAV
ncbi:hypothetical protein M2163_001626 [Streptomyces sp. SAI-135]|nr:hypothetical protein [Streptomyces sp. SAI-090]MDH6614518.1 hypothetical protein [Streptomyces sp. SAI-135]